MRFALVTPWPPDGSGIAEYAYNLVEGLLQKGLADIEIFTRNNTPKNINGLNRRSTKITY